MDESRERSIASLEAYFRQRGETPQTAAKLAERMMPAETAGNVGETVGVLESWRAHFKRLGCETQQAESMARIASFAGTGVAETVAPVTESKPKHKPKVKEATSRDVALRELREMGLRGYGE